MNKIEKWILDTFEDLRHELDGTYDEMEQAAISEKYIPLDKVYNRIKDIETLELEIVFEEKEGCKIYNVHADEDTYYVEEYDGFAEDEFELEEFMETAKLRNITDKVDVIDLLYKAFEAEEEGKAEIS